MAIIKLDDLNADKAYQVMEAMVCALAWGGVPMCKC